ncbi:nuclear transport factor 2 family protein [Skermania sp. ID1734]|uniref:nuclear transport factor 2 family protein n=1 Tax=Skermania sp. ID1734 TaxID=2597516 RepID=UPI00117C7927|nr:nuclear transport factor 2 family protein [Skermania sp. ID1734]TSE01845.1 nuclear transport factor 2 family protein [Skermania sp. ID1734]
MPTPAELVARRFIEAFATPDLDTMRELLDPVAQCAITNPEGGVDVVLGTEYISRVAAMDVPSANLRLDITQLTPIEPGRVMAMVEVHAERGERKLHNHAAHLIDVVDGRITRIWMVEALPAESAAFWSRS